MTPSTKYNRQCHGSPGTPVTAHNVTSPDATNGFNHLAAGLDDVRERLGRLEGVLNLLVEQRTAKEYYGTEEAARILGKAEFTVREWCRLGRVHAQKRGSGRGKYQSWVISHQELLRIQKEGLLPPR